MGPAHDNKLSPAIESGGVCASLDWVTWTVNGKSPFSPPREALFLFQPSPEAAEGEAVWLCGLMRGLGIRTSRPLWGSAGDFSPGLDTVGLLFLRGKTETTMLASPTERRHTSLKTFNTSGHPERKLGCPGQLIIFSKTLCVFEMCQRFCWVTLERI